MGLRLEARPLMYIVPTLLMAWGAVFRVGVRVCLSLRYPLRTPAGYPMLPDRVCLQHCGSAGSTTSLAAISESLLEQWVVPSGYGILVLRISVRWQLQPTGIGCQVYLPYIWQPHVMHPVQWYGPPRQSDSGPRPQCSM